MHRSGTVPEAGAAAPAPGAHGDDRVRVARALGVDPSELLDLAATTNPLAPDPSPVVARHAAAVGRYPDETAARAALAAAMGVDPARLLLTNGGAEAIALVAALHPAGWVEEPDFSLYRRHLRRLEPGAPRWMSDPRTPTGLLAAPGEIVFVRDEAFFPLAAGRWTRGDPGTVVVGSLTKLLACPGLRLGYVLARDPDEAALLAALRPRWSVNALAAEALPELLAPVDLPAWRQGLAALRADLVGVLAGHGLRPLRSDAPWLLVPGAAGLRETLVRQRVLVRDCSSFGLPGHVRVAVPDAAGLERLDAALGRVGA